MAGDHRGLVLRFCNRAVTFSKVSSSVVIRRFAGSASGKAKKGAIVIGPAGENHVCFAVIENDYWRSAGRTGVGCVLGSKRLKAILFQGDCSRKLADRKAISVFSKGLAKEAKDNAQVAAYKNKGTPMMVKIMNEGKAFMTSGNLSVPMPFTSSVT
ncbi:MAG: hypothetical protein JRF28_08645 [Deltaproteobacteria bacterium]|nr:hypothetical protein [Deltaproteobacteria bacterium]